MKKIALCIGNNNYKNCLEKLNCAINDSNEVSNKLRDLGFEVENFSDLNRTQMHDCVNEFEKKLKDYEVALFFFAGHGFESNGENELMPIDIDSLEVGKVDFMALKLNYVIDALEGKKEKNNLKVKIIILDACRGIVNGRGKKNSNFSAVLVPVGTIIAFSTSPGQIAYESPTEGHGYFTKALLKSIDIPRMPIERVFKKVREQLSIDLGGKQISWEHTSLMGDFYFNDDNLDSGFSYSQDALSDSNYFFEDDALIKNIVVDLKSYNFYIQNPAISKIFEIDFDIESANNLFVLGRNIYQSACGNSIGALNFINNFEKQDRIPQKAKIHILNGMAYEIYFDKNSDFRRDFKSKHYLKVIKLLEFEIFQASKNFIVEVIKVKSNRIIYLPGNSSRFDFTIKIIKFEYIGTPNVFKVNEIFYVGQNILHFIEDGTDHMFEFCDLHELKIRIAEKILAPIDMINFSFNAKFSEGSKFAIHFDSELLIQTN